MDVGWILECKLPDIVHNDGAGILTTLEKSLLVLKSVTNTTLEGVQE